MPATKPLPTASSFPAELTDRPQWLVWRYIQKPGQKKPSKMPYYATTGHLRGWPFGKPADGIATPEHPQEEQGSELDREHLVNFWDAVAFAQARRFDGVGFAFLPGDGLIGIDLDAVLPAERQQAIRDAAGTFCEVSPSGTGLHIIGMGECETFKSNPLGIEVFCGRQFFTMPGQHDGVSPLALQVIPEQLLADLRAEVEAAKLAARGEPHDAAPAQTPPSPRPRPAADTEAMRYCLHALRTAVDRVSGCTEGGRNDTLNQEAYGLGQLLHHGVITETTVAAELAAAAKACGLPPGEAAATIRSGLRAGQGAPRPIPERLRPLPAPRRAAAPPSADPEPAAAPHVDPETGEILGMPPAPANDNEPQADFWPEPIDLFGVAQPPELPMDVLPEAIRGYVRDQAELLGCDPAIIGMSAIVAAAACIHDAIELQPKRHDLGWVEQPRLWLAVVGDPSARKSPAIAKATRCVRKIDMGMAEDNASAMADWQWQHEQWKEAKKADKSNPPPEPKRPPAQRLVVEDVTIEALSEVLKDNPRGVLCIKDELTGWFASMDAYKGGAKGASMDRALWLEAYNGGRHVIDRVQRGNIIVPNWSVSMIGGIQPDIMRRIASTMGNDGLLQRFMVLVARSAGDDVDRVPDMRAMDQFRTLFDHLSSIQPSGQRIHLSEAAHVVRERVAKLAGRMIKAFDHPHIQAWLGKWTGLFGRLLVTYHVIECATSGEYPTHRDVSEHTASMVERLMCDVLLHHAIHFYTEVIDAHERQENVRSLARTILAKAFERITKRDLTLHWKTSRKLEWWDVRATLETLCNMGWLEADPEAIDAADGKPKAWFVNPKAVERFSKQAERESERRREAAAVIREIREAAAKV